MPWQYTAPRDSGKDRRGQPSPSPFPLPTSRNSDRQIPKKTPRFRRWHAWRWSTGRQAWFTLILSENNFQSVIGGGHLKISSPLSCTFRKPSTLVRASATSFKFMLFMKLSKRSSASEWLEHESTKLPGMLFRSSRLLQKPARCRIASGLRKRWHSLLRVSRFNWVADPSWKFYGMEST